MNWHSQHLLNLIEFEYVVWLIGEKYVNLGKVDYNGSLDRLFEDDIQKFIDYNIRDVEIIDESKHVCGISLQGPTSAAILRLLGFDGIDDLKPFHLFQTKISNIPIMISRTGFTGDLGYEIFLKNNAANKFIERVWNAGTNHGLTAIGYNALNMARIEAGFIVANIDFISSDHAIRQLGLSQVFYGSMVDQWLGPRF